MDYIDKQRLYYIALGFVPKNSVQILARMEENGISAEEFFNMPMDELSDALALNREQGFPDLARQEALARAREEFEFTAKHHIRILSWLDDDYPARLREAFDAPLSLYVLGDANLDCAHPIALVGTRRCTNYGLNYTSSLVSGLAEYFPDLTVVSGLAYGIDAAAHRTALDNNLPTLAVMAHGLDMIYPARHRNLAKEIVEKGGAIISEYPHGIKPFPNNFLQRNRIVAALSDVTVVVESDIKGGAMSTARLAQAYNREVIALPGRVTDQSSLGCNHLIRTNGASMAGTPKEVAAQTGWVFNEVRLESQQLNLFPEISGDSQIIYDHLRFQDHPITIDEICHLTSLPISTLSALLSELEFDGIISRLPGNRYTIS